MRLLAVLSVLWLAGCTALGTQEPEPQSDSLIEQLRSERLKMNEMDNSTTDRLTLRRFEQEVFDVYFEKYLAALKQGDTDQAVDYLDICQEIMPEHEILAIERQRLERQIATSRGLERIQTLIDDGLDDRARQELTDFTSRFPNHPRVEALQNALKDAPSQTARMSLSLENTDVKDALAFVSRSFGISAIFEQSIKPASVSLVVDSIDFYDAIDYLTQEADLGFTVLNETTVLFYQRDKASMERFSHQFVQSYYLNAIGAKDMAAILRSVISLDSISVNEDLNVIIVKASRSEHALINEMIAINDHPKAEVLLEVEILEVNKSEADRLGIEYGSYDIGVQPGSVPLLGDQEAALRENGVITLPTVALSAFKQDVDAKTLSNPTVRVLDGMNAKIHIGDQVPLRASSITESTGQTKTTYEYRDTGIRLEVQPKIYTDNTVEINLQLEVSSLGENLGTISDPAYRIGTRVADTSMVLRNGETAMLGGLISEQDQDSATRVSGLGRIPIIRQLFNYDDDRLSRTDVLLSITPLVVRPVQSDDRQGRILSIGTDSSPGQRVRAELQALDLNFVGSVPTDDPDPIQIAQGERAEATNPVEARPTSNANAPEPEPRSDSNSADETVLPTSGEARIQLGEPEYTLDRNDTLTVPVYAGGIAKAGGYSLELAFNPRVSEFVQLTPQAALDDQVSLDVSDNRLFIDVGELEADFDDAPLFNLEFKAVEAGTSFIILRPLDLMDKGESTPVTTRNTRLRVE